MLLVNTLEIDNNTIDSHKQAVGDASEMFDTSSVQNIDTCSTISAVSHGNSAIQSEKNSIEKFAYYLTEEAKGIRELGDKFLEFDKMLSEAKDLHSVIINNPVVNTPPANKPKPSSGGTFTPPPIGVLDK